MDYNNNTPVEMNVLEIRSLLKEGSIEKFREPFLDLHPNDQMQVLFELEKEERKQLYAYLAAEELAAVFQLMEYEDQFFTSIEMDDERLAAVLNEMYADDVADFIGKIPQAERKEALLEMMDQTEALEVREIMSYPEKTAGAVMTKEFLEIFEDQRIDGVMAYLRKAGNEAESVYYLYVVGVNGELVGVVSLRDIIVSDADRIVKDVMNTQVISVDEYLDQEEAAQIIKDYDLLAAPVVTKDNKLVGIITFDDAMDVLEEEVTEDIEEISASKGSTDPSLNPFQAAVKRAPWIVLLMFLGLITANLINQYEETLEAIVVLSVFIPLIMGAAGNAGTQSLAVVVRNLATGALEKKGLFLMLRRELGTGILMGAACSVVLLALVTLLYGNIVLAFIVAISLLLSLSAAALIGAVFPIIIDKLRIDPAVASGPFITTMNDIVGLSIYFSIATALLEYL
ncbi:magnesium transporter [Sinobaca sp. H24]|uniref:magnesium transporter n=1 Tax=Sinobaca sp. H24 TaxID=2923376 RepID=UPI0020795C98|nr:magnesium transporter [Sinobaca sp. H24]